MSEFVGLNPERVHEMRILGGLMELGFDVWWDFDWFEDLFDDTANRSLFTVIAGLAAENKSFDRATVELEVFRLRLPVEVRARVFECWQDKAVTVVDFAFWFGLLYEGYVQRELTLQGKRLADDPVENSDAIGRISELKLSLSNAKRLQTVDEGFSEYRENRRKGLSVISTGEPSVDKMLGGGWRAGMYGIAGRPKQGKSMVMLHFARLLAQAGRKVLFVSYEMPKEQVYDRLLASLLSIDSNLLSSDELDFEFEFDGELRWARDVVDSFRPALWQHIVVDNPVDKSVSGLQALIERTDKKLQGLDAVFVDYAQIMDLPKFKGSDWELHAKLSGQLQHLTMTLELPIITGLQLKKAETLNPKKTPDASDIAQSDKYARDVVAVLYLIRSHLPEDDPFSTGSELLLKLSTSRFTTGAATRFVAEDKFSRITHTPWR